MSAECKDFINKCLAKKPENRLGSKNDIEEILAHPWFASLNIDEIKKRNMPTEFKPKLSSDIMDVSNFDKTFTQDEAEHTVTPVHIVKKIAK